MLSTGEILGITTSESVLTTMMECGRGNHLKCSDRRNEATVGQIVEEMREPASGGAATQTELDADTTEVNGMRGDHAILDNNNTRNDLEILSDNEEDEFHYEKIGTH
jgi:hypothetical protein